MRICLNCIMLKEYSWGRKINYTPVFPMRSEWAVCEMRQTVFLLSSAFSNLIIFLTGSAALYIRHEHHRWTFQSPRQQAQKQIHQHFSMWVMKALRKAVKNNNNYNCASCKNASVLSMKWVGAAKISCHPRDKVTSWVILKKDNGWHWIFSLQIKQPI